MQSLPSAATSGAAANESLVLGMLSSYAPSSMAQRKQSALLLTSSPARNRDLLRPFSPPLFSVYPHCLPLQTTDSFLSLLSFLPEAPLHIPSFATPRASPVPPAGSRAAPPLTAAVPSPSSSPLMPDISLPTRTHALLTSFLPHLRPSNSFPRPGPPASTPSAVDSRQILRAHSIRNYNLSLIHI